MRRIFICLVLIIITIDCSEIRSQIGPPIYGTVVSQSRQAPIGGVTVSLVSPTLGRSTPVFTQPNGSYFFTNVPAGQSYYIEAYWGNTLLYRGVVNYWGGSVAFNIVLP
jgi:hypothetical protein